MSIESSKILFKEIRDKQQLQKTLLRAALAIARILDMGYGSEDWIYFETEAETMDVLQLLRIEMNTFECKP